MTLKSEAIISKNSSTNSSAGPNPASKPGFSYGTQWYYSFREFIARVSQRQVSGDVFLLVLVLAMVLFGLLMVYSASFIFAEERTGDGFTYIRKQFLYAILGFGAMFVSSRIPHRKWYEWAPFALFTVMALLVMVMIPGIGARSGGAQRWINLGIFRFQPAELAKLVGVMFVGRQLVRHQRELHDFRKGIIAPVALLIPVMVLLLAQPDFGSTVLLAGTTFILMFIAGVRPLYLFGGLFGGLGAAVTLIVTSPYRMQRVMTFIDPWRDPAGKGFQVIQSMLGLANGSLLGQGLGNGKEKLFFLPEAHNDFIFAVIGEELGFIGVAGVILAYILFIYRGLKISWTSLHTRQDRFGFYLGCGISLILGLQAFINMGVVMGLLPTKGLTLPFISYGGSALTLNLFSIGILYSISRMNNGVSGSSRHH